MKRTFVFLVFVALVVTFVFLSLSAIGSGIKTGDELIAKKDFSLKADSPLLNGPERCLVQKGERVSVMEEGQYSNGSAGLTPLVKLSAEHCSGWVINDSSLNRLLEKP